MSSNNVPTEHGGSGLSRAELALYIGVPAAAVCIAGAAYYLYSRESDTGDGEEDTKPEQSNEEEDISEQDPLKKAEAAKLRGNKYFQGRKFDTAIKCYSDAIDMCPPEHTKQLSVFYQNRAAAHEKLKHWTDDISDCSKAIEYDNKYSKALARRARAYDNMDMPRECLHDATAVCLLEGFRNQDCVAMADRTLKTLGKELATEHYKRREFSLPSGTFIKSYLESFHEDVFSCEASEEDETPNAYCQAFESLKAKKYDGLVDLCTTEIDAEGKYLGKALLLRATLHTLMSNITAAMADFDNILEMEESDDNSKIQVNALIKRGSLFMQQAKESDCFADFERAEKLLPDNPDIYHHRGQIYFLTEKLDKARDDFAKAIQLAPTFVHPKLQVAYCTCRLAMQLGMPGMLKEANTILEETTHDYPNAAEAWSLHGQLLQDQQQFDEAMEKIDEAMKLQPENPTYYVYKALLVLQSTQNMEEAQKLLEQSIDADDKCDFAYETLATLHVQRGNLEKAIEYFEKAIELVRTEAEMVHTYSLLEAAKAQCIVTKNLGIELPKSGIM